MKTARPFSSRLRRGPAQLVAVVVSAMLVMGGIAVSHASTPDVVAQPATVADALIEQLRSATGDDDVLNKLLDAAVEVPVPGAEPVMSTLRELINAVGADKRLAEEGDDNGDAGNGGGNGPVDVEYDIEGLPIVNAGNLLHIYVGHVVTDHVPCVVRDGLAGCAEYEELPEAPDLKAYDVIESEYSPDTPIVPVPNPAILAPALVPGEAQDALDALDMVNEALDEAGLGVELPLLLVTHWGGKLKSVQADDYMTGFRSVGSTLIGSNVDTAKREADEDADDNDFWPFWVPLFTGDLALPTDAIDFVGFAMVIEEQICVEIPLGWFGGLTRVCTSFGTMLGDGVTFIDGTSPFSPRDIPVIWDPAPEPIPQVIEAIDGAVGEVTAVVDELLATLGIDVDEILDGVLDPDDGGNGGGGDDDGPPAASDPVSELVGTVLGLLGQ